MTKEYLNIFLAPEQIRDYIVVELLFLEKDSLVSIANELNVSLNFIKKEFDNVKKFLQENQIEITLNLDEKIVIKENENKIRLLISNYLIKRKYMEDINKKLEIEKKLQIKNYNIIQNFFKNIEYKLNIILSEEALNFLVYYVIGSIFRKKQNKNIVEGIKNKNFLLETEEYKYLKSEIKNLEKSLEIMFLEEEVLLLTELLIGSHSYNFNESYYENWIEIDKKVLKFIKSVERELNINLIQDLHLVKGLENHMRPTYYRIKKNISLNDMIVKEVKEEYYQSFLLIENIFNTELENFLGKKIPEEEICYITLHFETAKERQKNKKIKKDAI